MSMTIESHLVRMSIESHLAVRHNVWRFDYAQSEAPHTYGSMVSEENLHVIHAKLHERDPEGDHQNESQQLTPTY